MFFSSNFMQSNRLMRLAVLLIIVGLSMILYTSYCANQTMDQSSKSQRFHKPSLISVSSLLQVESSTVSGNTVDEHTNNTFQTNGINNTTGIASSSSSNNSNIDSNLLRPIGVAAIDRNPNNSQITQKHLLGNHSNDDLSNSLAHFNVSNTVQQTNLPGKFGTIPDGN